MVCSLMPLLVLLFAACLLGEKVTKKDFLLLVCVFTAVVLVLIGAEGSDKKTFQTDWVAVTCLAA
jgi:drug/metabolite transporter (DMT)-like permease